MSSIINKLDTSSPVDSNATSKNETKQNYSSTNSKHINVSTWYRYDRAITDINTTNHNNNNKQTCDFISYILQFFISIVRMIVVDMQ